MSDLDPKTKLKAARAKLNGVKSKTITADDGIYVAVPFRGSGAHPRTEVVYFRHASTNVQCTNLPRRVKKGCGQRKNKRDKAGRARHITLLPYGHQPTVVVAG